MSFRADVAVLGAGMVGVSLALHLQRRGREVVLVDRAGAAGEETSYGNAGLIERSSVFPYMFPRDLGFLGKCAFNLSADAHYHPSALPTILPWLVRYFLNSSPQGAMRSARAALPLIEQCLREHELLMAEANASHLLRKIGWIKLFSSQASLDKGLAETEKLKPYAVNYEILDAAAVHAREPHLSQQVIGAVHLLDPGFVSDPGALVKAYAALFQHHEGVFVQADAKTLQQTPEGWSLDTSDGKLAAREVVIALGPWSDDLFRPLGYRIPLGIKRGYHLHFSAHGNAVLNHPVLDVDGGYVLAPMTRGIRLTTGTEFALRDAAPTPVQIEMTEPRARRLFPLERPIEDFPWMGRRPCLPDMLPVIGKGHRHKGLWFDFGHQHHGFTLGPVTGRLLAEMIVGETPFTDPAPYAATRFD
jgi:D-amino-acid dehydrogenase